MRSSDSELILVGAFLYSIFNLIIFAIGYVLIEELQSVRLNIEYLFSATAVASILIGYFLFRFILSPITQTKKELDSLLKDTVHELNIPISTILANVSMLKKDENDPKKLKRLDRIEKGAKILLENHDELDYKIRVKIGKQKKEKFDIKSVVQECYEVVCDIKCDIKFHLDVESFEIYCDKNGFKRAILNLLKNSIKYNKKDGFVKIYTKKRDLIVEDSGIGIEQDKILHVFDRYYQGDSKSRGYGIGLFFVKEWADESGVKIFISSKESVGTKILLTINQIAI